MTTTGIGLEVGTHTRRKIGARLLPFLFLLYIVNYLDRTSLAYATLGMSRDLGFSDEVVGLGAGVFFVSYVALQIPGALLVERWSARRMISLTMVSWGLLTTLTALVRTPGQLYLARFVLGAAEAGFFPGVIVYLSHWFLREDRAKASSNFMAAIPLSFIVASPIAGLILSHTWFGVEGWRWLFVLEGLPAIVLGVIAFFYLTDWPHDAGWLKAEERESIQQALREEVAVRAQTMSVAEALRSRAVLVLAAVTFFNYFVLYTIVFWLPTLLKRMSSMSDVSVGFLGTAPYIASLVLMQVNAWHSDRTQDRRWHCAIPMLVGILGLLGLFHPPASISMLVGLFTVAYLGSIYLPVFWTIPTEILSKSTAPTAVGMINAIGSVAGFAGPYLFGYLHTRTGSLSAGFTTMVIASLAGGLLILWTPRRAGASAN